MVGGFNRVYGNSARSLLFLLLQSLSGNEPSRKEVLIPGYTCYSVAAAVVKAGLGIAVYDVEPKTLEPDFNSLRRKLSENTLAVISQHLFGISSEIGLINEMAHAQGAVHIEDAAQAMGGSDRFGPLGTKGDFGLFSLGRGKPLPLGRGGILISSKMVSYLEPSKNSKHSGVADVVKVILARIFSRPSLYHFAERLPIGLGKTPFDPDFKVKGISSAIKGLLFRSMPLLEPYNRHRRKIANQYKNNLPPESLIDEPQGSNCVYNRFPILAPTTKVGLKFKHLGVRRMYPSCIVDERKIRTFIHSEEDTPGARELAQRLITLPTHSRISPSTAWHISNALQNDLA